VGRVGHRCPGDPRVQKAEGPSKYEFEGPSLGRVCPVAREGSRSPGGLPGPARHVRLPGATAGPRPVLRSCAHHASSCALPRELPREAGAPGFRRTRLRALDGHRRCPIPPARVASCGSRRMRSGRSLRLPESSVHHRFPWASTTVPPVAWESSTGHSERRASGCRRMSPRSFRSALSGPVDVLGTALLSTCGQVRDHAH
jgi:hypothetical protein